MQGATLVQKMAGRPRGWPEIGGLPTRPQERQRILSTCATSRRSNSLVVVDERAIRWACVVVVVARLARAITSALCARDAKIQVAATTKPVSRDGLLSHNASSRLSTPPLSLKPNP